MWGRPVLLMLSLFLWPPAANAQQLPPEMQARDRAQHFADYVVRVEPEWAVPCDLRPGDEGWGRERHPAINVSWQDAQLYVAWLSQRTGKAYRLLTEAEWEYAARAGTVTAFSTRGRITPEQARYNWTVSYADSPTRMSYEQRTAPVGSFAPNGFGLSDMHGNVWEWVQDCYRDTYNGAPTDGRAVELAGCSSRVMRGGSWYDLPRLLRSAYRGRNTPRLPQPRCWFSRSETALVGPGAWSFTSWGSGGNSARLAAGGPAGTDGWSAPPWP